MGFFRRFERHAGASTSASPPAVASSSSAAQAEDTKVPPSGPEVEVSAKDHKPKPWVSKSDLVAQESKEPPAPPSYQDSQETQLRNVITSALYLAQRKWPCGLLPSPGTVSDSDNLASILEYIALAPCTGQSFLERIRQYLDSPSISEEVRSYGSTRLQELGAGRGRRIEEESPVLLLAARTLARYYAAMGNRNTLGYGKLCLDDIRACGMDDCGCADYDATTAQNPVDGLLSSSAPPCFCGHGFEAHDLSRRGIEKLVNRYCNWEPSHYYSLVHRNPGSVIKNELKSIARCAVEDCSCYDYDDQWGTCKCGHDGTRHLNRQRGMEDWDLSWILVERCYMDLLMAKQKDESRKWAGWFQRRHLDGWRKA